MPEKVDIRIGRVDACSFLQIGKEQIEIADYNIKSSADGSTELSVVIKGATPIFETSASLEVLMNPDIEDLESYINKILGK